MTEKWFGSIPRREVPQRNLPQEQEQTEERRLTVERNVPLDSLFMAYHMPAHCHPDYYAFDILSDVLSNGRSSRLNQRLVQQKQLFSSIDAYISGSVDAGLFHISGKPSAGVTLEQAEAAVREELELLQQELVDEQELEKVKNKFESRHYSLHTPIEAAYHNREYSPTLRTSGVRTNGQNRYVRDLRRELPHYIIY